LFIDLIYVTLTVASRIGWNGHFSGNYAIPIKSFLLSMKCHFQC